MDPEARLESERLLLEPLKREDADELFSLLDDPRLHRFTGGEPASLDELRVRYQFLEARRSPDGKEQWLNWAVRVRETGAAVGTVQATVTDHGAHVAWVIGSEWQGRGFASEAALALVEALLHDPAIGWVAASIAPGHDASERVAERAGLQLTDEVVDGERVWRRARLDG